MKVWYLISGIKSGALNSVKATILASAPYSNNYAASVIIYKDYNKQEQDTNVELNIMVLVLEPVSHQARGPSLVGLNISITRQQYTRSSQRIRGRKIQTYARNTRINLAMVGAEIAVVHLSSLS